MSTNKRLVMGVLSLLVLVVAGWLFIVWPVYREIGDVNERMAELRRKSEASLGQTQEIERLTTAIREASDRIDSEFKSIPDSPNIAGLMRSLSLPVDNVTIRDQTFTAGQTKDAVPGADFPVKALPLTVDMVSRFDAVFALIRAAEAQDQLVRVSSVNIASSGDDDQEEPLVTASIRLDAVFEPVQAREGR